MSVDNLFSVPSEVYKDKLPKGKKREDFLTTIDNFNKTKAGYYFSKRKGREGPSRVALDQDLQETSIISIVAEPIDEKQCNLISAWYGSIAPKEPWDNSLMKDKKALDESLRFWCCHALVYEVDFMQEPFISTWDKVVSGIK